MFELKVNVGDYKKGRIFDSFGGLVRGMILGKKLYKFDNKKYFKFIGE